MTDRNIEDSEIQSAPKLIEVVFQNCKGHVDHWVEPYLRHTIDRLQRAETSYLKSLLVQVVRTNLKSLLQVVRTKWRVLLLAVLQLASLFFQCHYLPVYSFNVTI